MEVKKTGTGLFIRKIFSTVFFGSTLLIPFILFGAPRSVSDNFDRPSTGAVTSSTVPNPIGAQYVINSGTWEIGANTYLQASAAGFMIDTGLEALRSIGHRFTLRLNVLHPNYTTSQGGRQAGVILNYRDDNNYYTVRWGNNTDGVLGSIQVVKRENGVNTQLGELVTGLTLPGSIWFTWEFSSSDNTDEIVYSVSEVGSPTPLYTGSFTDGSFSDGNVGFYRTGGGTVRFDDYSLTVTEVVQPTLKLIFFQ